MAKREDILISKQLEMLTDKIDYILDNEIKQLFYTKSHKMKKDSQAIIKKFDRIDTSIMIKGVHSFVEINKSNLVLTLESNAKLRGKESYSSFNELGTSKMAGIFFIQDSFNQNIKGIEKEIDNIIKKVTI